MKCEEIIALLEKQSPTEYAEAWDNVGLLVGRKSKEIKRILLALDATKEVCSYAINNHYDMIVTHHPMIFSKINRVNDESVLGDKIISLIEHGICCYAMHTNFDTIGGMARIVSSILDIDTYGVLEETKDGEGIGCVGELPSAMTLRELACFVKDKFGLDNVIVFGKDDEIIKKVAVSPGSGKDEIEYALEKRVDCLLTGDIGHHSGIDAVEMGLTIIDASHHGLEKIFMEYIKEYLTDNCDKIEVDILDTGVPYKII